MFRSGNIYQFADWKVIVGANLCEELGYDVYLNNPAIFGGENMYMEKFFFTFTFCRKILFLF